MSSQSEFCAEDGAEYSEEEQPYSIIRKQLIILGFFPLSEAIAWATISPYIYSMVQSFSSSESNDQNAAVYAGIMISVFTFGDFPIAPQWARISDRIGRKPTLLMGSVGAMISATLFGFSNSLPMAIAARTCAGLLNPNLGVVQTFIGELVRKDQQAKGFSVVPFSSRVWVGMSKSSAFASSYPLSRTVIGPAIGGYLAEESLQGGYTSINTGKDITELANVADSVNCYPKKGPPKRRSAFTKQVILQILSVAILGFLKIATLAMIPIFLATPSQSSNSAMFTGNLEILRSIFGINGGFGLDAQSISNALLTQAVAAIISQILVVHRIIARQGPLLSYRIVLAVLLCLYCMMPFAVGLPNWLAISAILVMLWIYALANGLGTTCSAILITNTAPSPIYLATINGMAASLGCLARTLGPVISGPLFRLGLEVGYIGLPFWTLGAVAGLPLTSIFEKPIEGVEEDATVQSTITSLNLLSPHRVVSGEPLEYIEQVTQMHKRKTIFKAFPIIGFNDNCVSS